METSEFRRSRWATWIGLIILAIGLMSFAWELNSMLTQGRLSYTQDQTVATTAFVGNLGNIAFGWFLFRQTTAVFWWLAYGMVFSIALLIFGIVKPELGTDFVAGSLIGIAIQAIGILLVVRFWKKGGLRI